MLVGIHKKDFIGKSLHAFRTTNTSFGGNVLFIIILCFGLASSKRKLDLGTIETIILPSVILFDFQLQANIYGF